MTFTDREPTVDTYTSLSLALLSPQDIVSLTTDGDRVFSVGITAVEPVSDSPVERYYGVLVEGDANVFNQKQDLDLLEKEAKRVELKGNCGRGAVGAFEFGQLRRHRSAWLGIVASTNHHIETIELPNIKHIAVYRAKSSQ